MLSDSDLDEICYHTEYTCGFSLTVIGAWAAAGQWNAVKIVQYSGYTETMAMLLRQKAAN